jgi:hypothetical protein
MKLPIKLTLAVLVLCSAVWADTTENFNDITTLAGAGWVMVNNSNPAGSTGWFQGDPSVFSAQSGAPDSYIAANFNNAGFGGNVSNWLITPEMTLFNGEVVSFYARTEPGGSIFNDGLELRLSTNGASTNVGATDSSVGDFTTLLLSINASQNGSFPEDWTLFTATISGLSGSGTAARIALRYDVTDTSVNGDYIGVDHFSVPEPSSTALALIGVVFIGISLLRYKPRLA